VPFVACVLRLAVPQPFFCRAAPAHPRRLSEPVQPSGRLADPPFWYSLVQDANSADDDDDDAADASSAAP
jgi:hypothetical protein